MNKAIFIGGQEDGATRKVTNEPKFLHFIEHPHNHEVITSKNRSYKYEEITYRLIMRTPGSGVLVYELIED